MARPSRNHTGLQMIVAMAVLVIPIALVTTFFTSYPETTVDEVAWVPVAQQAASEADFTVLAPQNLPQGWVATRARWTPAGQPGIDRAAVPGDTWQLGFLSPAQTYLGLDQRATAPEPFIVDKTRKGRSDGQSTVGGVTWERYVSEDGRTRSLVLRSDSAVVVSGDLDYEALEAFASTLAPVG